MPHPSEVRITSAQPAPTVDRSFILRVCTNNPFYVLSAVLFLLGLRVSFGAQVAAAQTWSLFGGLSVYTLLLAGTAALLVRFGNVWDDVRTVLLLIVLMFLASSVTFDQVLFQDLGLAFACYVGGLLLAVAVSEGLLFGIRLRLPALLRVPYYLTLGLFFLYPLALRCALNTDRGEPLQWGLFCFSIAAALVALSLLPAIRRGADYSAANGSPWPWPFYPWVLFGLLGAAVPVRAFLLCWSLHGIVSDERTRMLFQPYFLAPFGLAVAVLLLEFGIVTRRQAPVRAALLLPVLVACLALIGYNANPIQGFRATFATRLHCDPLNLTLLGSAAFYGYAALRNVRFATEALSAALVAAAFVTPKTIFPYTYDGPFVAPIIGAALLQLVLGLWQRDGLRCLLGIAGTAAGVVLVLPGTKHGTPWNWLIAYHVAMIGLLLLGAAFDGRFGQWLRAAGATLVLLACLVATFVEFKLGFGLPSWSTLAYAPIAAALLTVYCLLLRDRHSLAAPVLAGIGWLSEGAWHGYESLQVIIPGLNLIAISLAFFAVAIIISLGKAGLLSKWVERWYGSVPNLPRFRVAIETSVTGNDVSGAESLSDS